MTAESIPAELEEYRTALSDAAKRLEDIRKNRTGFDTHADQAGVLLTAIEGLQTKLSSIDDKKITLIGIVDISNQVQNVLDSAEQFLMRNSPITI